jgi:hypothetical protein
LRLTSESVVSSVHLAGEEDLGKRVVLKILSRQFADEPDFRVRFQREMLAAARPGHDRVAVGGELHQGAQDVYLAAAGSTGPNRQGPGQSGVYGLLWFVGAPRPVIPNDHNVVDPPRHAKRASKVALWTQTWTPS